MDTGRIDILNEELLQKAQYKEDLQTMDTLEVGVEVVVIHPHESSSIHVIKVEDFIHSNLEKIDFENMYNRNRVTFSDSDIEKLIALKKEALSKVKSIPHEIFIKLLGIISEIMRHHFEMYYFSFIVRSLEQLMTILPVFENINEAYGNMEPQTHQMIETFYKSVNSFLDEEMTFLENPEYLEKVRLEIEFTAIPHDYQEMISDVFRQLYEFMVKISEVKLEFKYTRDIITIAVKLETIKSWYHLLGSTRLFISDEKIIEKLFEVQSDIEKLKQLFREN